MNTGLTLEQWHAVSEGWRPDDRAFALELMAWTWKHDALLPDNLRTLQRIARADDTRAFKAAWSRLSTSGAFLLVLGSSHWHVPLQDAARAVKKARSRAGKASVAARRADRLGPLRSIPPAPPLPAPDPIGAPALPPGLAALRAPRAESASVGRPVSGAFEAAFDEKLPGDTDVLVEIVRTSTDLDTVALAVAQLVLSGRVAPMEWDAFRDAAAMWVETAFVAPKTPRVDKTALTYRVWDETFLGSYRDRFTATKQTIVGAAPISRSTTPSL